MPAPANPSLVGRVLKVLFKVAAVLFCAWVAIFFTLSNFKPSPPRESVKVTADALYQQYKANEVATDLAYKNKDVVVYGRVESVNKNAWNGIYVSLATPQMYTTANLHLRGGQGPGAAGCRHAQGPSGGDQVRRRAPVGWLADRHGLRDRHGPLVAQIIGR